MREKTIIVCAVCELPHAVDADDAAKRPTCLHEGRLTGLIQKPGEKAISLRRYYREVSEKREKHRERNETGLYRFQRHGEAPRYLVLGSHAEAIRRAASGGWKVERVGNAPDSRRWAR